jgi:hypothetical protein
MYRYISRIRAFNHSISFGILPDDEHTSCWKSTTIFILLYSFWFNNITIFNYIFFLTIFYKIQLEFNIYPKGSVSLVTTELTPIVDPSPISVTRHNNTINPIQAYLPVITVVNFVSLYSKGICGFVIP